jgi:hypothetical protein
MRALLLGLGLGSAPAWADDDEGGDDEFLKEGSAGGEALPDDEAPPAAGARPAAAAPPPRAPWAVGAGAGAGVRVTRGLGSALVTGLSAELRSPFAGDRLGASLGLDLATGSTPLQGAAGPSTPAWTGSLGHLLIVVPLSVCARAVGAPDGPQLHACAGAELQRWRFEAALQAAGGVELGQSAEAQTRGAALLAVDLRVPVGPGALRLSPGLRLGGLDGALTGAAPAPALDLRIGWRHAG